MRQKERKLWCQRRGEYRKQRLPLCKKKSCNFRKLFSYHHLLCFQYFLSFSYPPKLHLRAILRKPLASFCGFIIAHFVYHKTDNGKNIPIFFLIKLILLKKWSIVSKLFFKTKKLLNNNAQKTRKEVKKVSISALKLTQKTLEKLAPISRYSI